MRSTTFFSIISLLVLALLAAACGRAPDDEPADEQDPDVFEVPVHGMPSERQDTLVVEGEPSAVTLRLFESPESPVLIYYPADDFSPAEVGSSQAYGVHFVATFGGVRNENAWIRYFFPHREGRLNDPDALQMLIEEEDGIADIEGFTAERIEGSGGCPGQARAWRVSSPHQSGSLCIGNRDDRHLLFIALYPSEYGDGFGPRMALMRQHTYWRDTEEAVFFRSH